MTNQPVAAPAASPDAPASGGRIGYWRWIICFLCFLAITINYVDRAVLGVLAPVLRAEIGWSDTQYGDVNAAFTLAYAFGFLFVGWMMDRIGTRLGYALSLAVWSLAAAGHALVGSAGGFAIARFFLGLGESGGYPGGIKTVSEWFPQKERALANGLLNAGANVGAVLAPLVVPWLVVTWSWRAAFLMTGLGGLVWIFLWWPLYRHPSVHPHVSKRELDYIQRDPPDPTEKVHWLALLGHRETWAFCIAKFLTDSMWWFYLLWFPLFMNDRFGVDIKTIGLPMVTVYLMADVGSIAGGWLSSHLIGRGWRPNGARKLAMLIAALCIVPVSLSPKVDSSWIAVFLIGLAASSHQAFSANLFTIVSDIFPRKIVGSVIGLGGFSGAIGALVMNLAAGRLREMTGSYVTMFTIASLAYVTALAILHILSPRLDPVRIVAAPKAA